MDKNQLLNAPYRKSKDINRHYTEVYIIPLEELHESGFNYISIIGAIRKKNKETTLGDGIQYEKCGQCDDLTTIFPVIDLENDCILQPVRMDCVPPSGILRYHGRLGYFTVGDALSSMEITFHKSK